MRLIDADELKKAFCCKFPSITPNEIYLCGRALDLIDNAPTVEAIPTELHEKIMDKVEGELLECQSNLRPQVECLENVIKLFNKYDVLLVHIDGKIVPVKNTTKQECYNLLYEIQELIKWRKLLWRKNNE